MTIPVTYQNTTPWTAPSVVTNPAVLDAFIRAYGQRMVAQSPQHTKDGTYRTPPALGKHILFYCQLWNLNSDMATGEGCVETAGYQSAIFVDKRNPAGLGAEDDAPYAKAIDFTKDQHGNLLSDDLAAEYGVRAWLAHVASYVHGYGDWNQYTPRFAILERLRYLGIAKTPQDLAGRYATDTEYGYKIARAANSLIAFNAEQRPVEPPVTRPPANSDRITDLLIRNGVIPRSNPNRPGTPMRAIGQTWHETANTARGANAEMHRRFLENGGGPEGVSFHWCVDDKEAIELIPDGDAQTPGEIAWHAGDGAQGTGNTMTVAIETCVNVDGDWNKTLTHLTLLSAKLCLDHGHGVDAIWQHNTWSGKNCPTIIRRTGVMPQLLAAVQSLLTGAVEPEHIVFDVPGIGEKWIINDMAARWQDHPEPLLVTGYPLSGEFGLNGDQTMQVFERAVFHYVPGSWPEKNDVNILRLGVDVAVHKGYLDAAGNAVHEAFRPLQALPEFSQQERMHFPETGHSLSAGFLAFWQAYGDVDEFGYPISEEFDEVNEFGESMRVQYFERARFEWQPGAWPEKYDTLLGRLGAYALDYGLITVP